MGLSVWQLLIVALVILVLFGRGKISDMMGDFGKGISSFKKGMKEEDENTSESGPQSSARIEAPRHEAKPADQAAVNPQPADKSES